MRRRAFSVVAVLCLGAAVVLGACGSDDNGGVIQTPATSLAPGTTAGGNSGGGTPGY